MYFAFDLSLVCNKKIYLSVMCSEETVVNEYAALTMLSLASYYSCKRTIFENKGIEALIRCLGSSDADVQKNSIDTLAILVQVCLQSPGVSDTS